MPAWPSAVGSPATPSLPSSAPPSHLWHVVDGAVLGAALPAVADL